MRSFGPAPTSAEIEALARVALAGLPAPFAASAAEIVLLVEEFADEATLAAMDIDDPYALTGLYVGRPLTERSQDETARLPDQIFLYRAPILLEWSEGEETLEHLVAHVLIHEVGHHFGLSDDDIDALERPGAE